MTKRTWVELLLELPFDNTLQPLLSECGLTFNNLSRSVDSAESSRELVEAVLAWPDLAVRDKLAARLRAGSALADGPGKRAMFEAAAGNAAALTGLALCKSDLHRSLWLYVHHPDLFDRAGDLDHFERNGATAQQHDLGVAKPPRTDAQAIAAFRASVCDFYQRELQCGDRCQAYVVERSPGVYLLSVHVKDLAMLQLEFDGDELKRRQGNPNIHSVLEYSAHTGVIRSLVKGGIKYHRTLIKAFCEHLLGESVDAQHLRPAALDLSALRAGCDVPQAHEDGFVAVQVKSLTLQSQDQQLKLECTAQLASGTRHVTDLIKDMLPGSERGNWTATAAQINLYYPPAPGRSRSKVVSVEITNRGRLNLHKFDTPLQAKLEGYLVSLGILQSGQTLSTRAGTGQGGALDGRV